ncbi:MAG TPA: aminotransferase class IV [Planctomycetota bacterium]|jgi:branched-subunit amino acid aminotransferase/4-amino-4-deoxychorismate lyase|nr:hypothetical protein [Planctomycetota bacterium]MDP6129363.1 aminotransferase class IV [Planctomycetota bacterium]MDP7245593.1 aminotransferase class IV [Planctomycetota bacterium]HJM39567.1 aminotransferase class IV [Planctomycetota bacterium]|tara:strand:+ start:42789 stop:43622 length:834 start_codon:yes stop_codon:yes gene_type:complete
MTGNRPVEVVLVDGNKCLPDDPIVSGNSLALLRGEGVFESFLVVDGKPPENMNRHAERLRQSAKLLGFQGSIPDLTQAFLQLLPSIGQGSWRVRFSLYRQDDAGALPVWTAGLAGPPPEEVDVCLSTLRRDPQNPLARAKTISRAGEQWASREARAKGAFDALLTTTDGMLAECTSANVLFWNGESLCTPALDCGILEGTTRADLLARSSQAGIPVSEGHFPLNELQQALEVYVTNAVIGVIPIRGVLGLREDFPGAEGPFLQTLREAYLGRKVFPS